MFHIEKQFKELSKVNDSLFVTNAEGAHDLDKLKKYKITHIVNVTKTEDCAYPNEFTYHSIKIHDSEQTGLAPHIEDFLTFMRTVEPDNKVVIHCEQGMSRSVSFAARWLMQQAHERGESVNAAAILKQIQKVRPCARPNTGFCVQLETMACDLNTALPDIQSKPQVDM